MLWAAVSTQIVGIPSRLRAAGMIAAAIALFGVIVYRTVGRSLASISEELEKHKHDSMHDDLTGLPNRALFDDRAEQAVRLTRRRDETAAIIVLDLDRFKETNDTVGNRAGDRLLAELANRLSKRLRGSDTVARIGGDEFGIVLPTVDSEANVVRVVEDLRRALTAPFMIDGVSVVVEVSAGIALIGEQRFPAKTYLQRAERALQRAKSDPARIAVHDPGVDDENKDQLALIAELRSAIAKGELRLFYQPKPRLRTGKVRKVEALIRWQHPTRGLLTPNFFIPLAERTGLMRPLTYWVLDEAMRQSREWIAGGRGITVAVNLSQQSLLDETMHTEVARVLERHGVPAKALEIEITESALVTDLAAAKTALERLAAQGVTLSIDDYGTGHSSLAHVKQLPVSCIKIDRSFVSGMESDSANAAIVRSTVALARDLGIKLVAEGVETEGEWEELRKLGCDYAQGFLISRPIPAHELTKWLEDNNERYTGPVEALPSF